MSDRDIFVEELRRNKHLSQVKADSKKGKFALGPVR